MFKFGLDIERSVCRMCNGFLIVLFFPPLPSGQARGDVTMTMGSLMMKSRGKGPLTWRRRYTANALVLTDSNAWKAKVRLTCTTLHLP